METENRPRRGRATRTGTGTALLPELGGDDRQAHEALMGFANPDKAAVSQRFFKTGKGEYAEGDRFLGITVPVVRRVSRQFERLRRDELERLLASPYNEERLLALLILAAQYRKGDASVRAKVVECYLRNRAQVNNWNLVDSSAPYILGEHLLVRDRSLLFQLVRSESLWERRIAVLATLAFIRQGDFADTLRLVESLLGDRHDLMHKACGWMLREVGKRDQLCLERFLLKHYRVMPRTMLRYAIERFSPGKRGQYLRGTATGSG